MRSALPPRPAPQAGGGCAALAHVASSPTAAGPVSAPSSTDTAGRPTPAAPETSRKRLRSKAELMGCTHSKHAHNDEAIIQSAEEARLQGHELLNRGDTEGARKQFQECLELAAGERDPRRKLAIEGGAQAGIGFICDRLGQYDKAVEQQDKALAISRKLGDRQGECTDLGGLGNAHFRLGHFEKAIEYLDQALDLSRELHDAQGEAIQLSGLGNSYHGLGQYEKAIEYHTKALDLSRRIDDEPGVANGLGGIANADFRLGRYDQAIEGQKQALDISRRLDDLYDVTVRLGNLGNVYGRLGQFEKAMHFHMQALEISGEHSFLAAQASHLASLGYIRFRLGEAKKAIELHNQALQISQHKTHDRQAVGQALGNIGIAYSVLGQYDEAIEHHNKALTISQELRDLQGEDCNEGGLGIAYSSLGQYEKAIEHQNKALAISRKAGDRFQEGNSLGNLGIDHLHLAERDPESKVREGTKAICLLEECLAVHNSIWKGLTADEQSLAVHGSIGAEGLTSDAHRISYDDTDTPVIVSRQLQRAHVLLEQPEQALECAERARARAFELLLAQQRLGSKDKTSALPSPPPLSAADLSELAIRENVALVIFSRVSRTELYAWVLGSKGDSKPAHEVIPLPSGDESLSLLVERTRRALGAGERSHHRHTRGAPSAALRELVDEFELREAAADSVRAPPSGDGASSGHSAANVNCTAPPANISGAEQQPNTLADPKSLLRECHKLLIEPLHDALAHEKHLLIVPDGALYGVPFAALLDANGKHLIESHAIRIVPSAGTLVQLERRRDGNRSLEQLNAVVVGNPSFKGWKMRVHGVEEHLQELKNAEREANLVAGLLRERASVTLLYPEEATKPAVREAMEAMRGSGVLHFATHGSPTGIFFAGSSAEGATLSMAEVQSLELRVRLAVLSACDTFDGELRADGLIGISRAFVAAGVLTLVASIWEASDRATCKLMDLFYKELLLQPRDGRPPRDTAIALQQAMVSMIRNKAFKIPIGSWAPFVVYGLSSTLID